MSHAPDAGSGAEPLAALTQRVVVSQSLFTAGHTLTVGGFFNYFVYGFHPSTRWLALLQAAPEFFETAGLFARPLVLRFASRKTVWMAGLLLGRLAALGIPLCALLFDPEARHVAPLAVILACVAVWYMSQGISYVAYLSWLSDLAPERQWGRFFAKRQIAHLATTLVLYAAAIEAAGWARRELGQAGQRGFFVVAFAIGGLVAMSSVVPMARVRSIPTPPESGRVPFTRRLAAALSDPNFRRLMGWIAQLALFQGLTQAVLTKYQIDVLGISLEWYLAMHATMLVLQTALSLAAGAISDRFGDVRALFLSSLGVGFALCFTLAATRETWFLQFGAYAVWGLFGIVNVCSQMLALRLAPRSDNTLHLGLFRQLTGLIAGLAGIAGGWWLDHLLKTEWSMPFAGRLWSGFHVILAVSLLGRLTAPLWLLRIRERVVGQFNPGGSG